VKKVLTIDKCRFCVYATSHGKPKARAVPFCELARRDLEDTEAASIPPWCPLPTYRDRYVPCGLEPDY